MQCDHSNDEVHNTMLCRISLPDHFSSLNIQEIKALIEKVVSEQGLCEVVKREWQRSCPFYCLITYNIACAGRIDILVNNAFMTPEDSVRTTQPFWEQGWVYLFLSLTSTMPYTRIHAYTHTHTHNTQTDRAVRERCMGLAISLGIVTVGSGHRPWHSEREREF